MESDSDGDGSTLTQHQKEQIEKFKANMNILVEYKKALEELLKQKKLKEKNKIL